MSSELPENVSDWPQDPYLLLGVTREAEWRDIRSAYARMTKKYRPDHHPQQFQRIRSAYEQISSYREFLSSFSSTSENSVSQVMTTDPFTSGSAEAVPLSPDSEAQEAPGRIHAELESFRHMLEDGRYAEGHELLVRMNLQYPRNEEVISRLCWMRNQFPGLLSGHDPVKLLVGESIESLSYPLWSQLFKHLVKDPDLLLSPQVDDWLTRSLPHYCLTHLLSLRWKIAASQLLFAKVRADLNHLEEQRDQLGTRTWAGLLLLALEVTAWFPHQDVNLLWDHVKAKFQSMDSDWQGLEYAFNRFDQLIEDRSQVDTNFGLKGIFKSNLARPAWKRDVASWVGLLQSSSIALDESWKSELERLLATWADSSVAALTNAENLCSHFPSLANIIYRFLRTLDCNDATSPHLRERAIEKLGNIWLQGDDQIELRNAKLEILEFCIEDNIDLDRVAQMLSGSSVQLYNILYEDLALALAITAVRRFWSLPDVDGNVD